MLIKLALLICYSLLSVRLRLYYGPYLSLSAYIYSIVELTLLTTCAVTISLSVYGLSYIPLALYMRTYILLAIWAILASTRWFLALIALYPLIISI